MCEKAAGLQPRRRGRLFFTQAVFLKGLEHFPPALFVSVQNPTTPYGTAHLHSQTSSSSSVGRGVRKFRITQETFADTIGTNRYRSSLRL